MMTSAIRNIGMVNFLVKRGDWPCSMLANEQLYDDNDQRHQEHQDGNAVDAVHVLHPLCARRMGISFFDIEVFGNLSQNTHENALLIICKITDC